MVIRRRSVIRAGRENGRSPSARLERRPGTAPDDPVAGQGIRRRRSLKDYRRTTAFFLDDNGAASTRNSGPIPKTHRLLPPGRGPGGNAGERPGKIGYQTLLRTTALATGGHVSCIGVSQGITVRGRRKTLLGEAERRGRGAGEQGLGRGGGVDVQAKAGSRGWERRFSYRRERRLRRHHAEGPRPSSDGSFEDPTCAWFGACKGTDLFRRLFRWHRRAAGERERDSPARAGGAGGDGGERSGRGIGEHEVRGGRLKSRGCWNWLAPQGPPALGRGPPPQHPGLSGSGQG